MRTLLLHVLILGLFQAHIIAATSVILPLYTPPTDVMWRTLSSSMGKYPDINFTVIINPANGPGSSSPSLAWLAGLTYLKRHSNANIIGYVYTSYELRPIDVVKADVSAYASWPAVVRPSGIFFDEVALNNVSHYSNLTSFAKSEIGDGFVTLNPGSLPTPAYFDFADQVMIHEQTYEAYTAGDNKTLPDISESKYAVIVHTLPATGSALKTLVCFFTAAKYGSIYVTDDPATYHAFGSNWDSFLDLLNRSATECLSPAPGRHSDSIEQGGHQHVFALPDNV